MNRLADETSPYLRQHRDNPVDWYPWGPEAFAAAEERDVPILLSVGYSACHWCHVMAHECFENAEVAAKMNELFVNVKVDREERPDVDALYMDAVQALTGRGGWPMTVFMTPAREPFFGGTYFPKEAFVQLLDAIDDVYRNKPGDVTQNVTALTTALSTSAQLRPKNDAPGLDVLNAGLQNLARAFDTEWGGFGQPPKFPTASHLELMLRAYMTTAGDGPKRIIQTTLDAMCSGGMYDHVGGGFARYSTDREWLVPHFEKMLYDQALLLGIYLKGLIVVGRPDWRLVIEETIAYVLTELRHPDGGFYSAEDADSLDPDGNTVEGWFSTWTPDEVRAALPQVEPAIVDTLIDWYGITDEGNFEGRSIPNRIAARGQLLRTPELDAAVAALRAARARRPRPGLDDKVLTEWNALFLSSLAQAAAVFGRRDWLDAAIANGEFLLRELRAENGRWFRSWQADGRPPARHMALAADHAGWPKRAVRRDGSPKPSAPPTRCWTGSSIPNRVGCSPRPRTPRRWSSARRTSSTAPRRRPTRQRRSHCSGSRRSPASSATPTRPTGSCTCSLQRSRSHRGSTRTRWSPPICVVAASPRSSWSATARTWCDSPSRSGVPTPCWPGASPTTRRCGPIGRRGSATCAATTPANSPRTRCRDSRRR